MKQSYFHKKAFTMVEMLICMVCIAFLTIAVASFHNSVMNQTLGLKNEEDKALLEHSDVSRLRSASKIDTDLINSLNHSQSVSKTNDLMVGSTWTIDPVFTLYSGQFVVYESSDQTIATVDGSDGVVTGVSSGITYITATVCDVDAEGRILKTTQHKNIPIRVYDSTTQTIMTSFDIYYYFGEYYDGWFIAETEVVAP